MLKQSDLHKATSHLFPMWLDTLFQSIIRPEPKPRLQIGR